MHIKSEQTGEGNTKKINIKYSKKKVFGELQKFMGLRLRLRKGKGKMNYITGDPGRTRINQGIQI